MAVYGKLFNIQSYLIYALVNNSNNESVRFMAGIPKLGHWLFTTLL